MRSTDSFGIKIIGLKMKIRISHRAIPRYAERSKNYIFWQKLNDRNGAS